LRNRIVFLTGDMLNPETRDFLKRSGAVSLPKPFRVLDILHVIHRALARSGAADA
jgi:hypothetical protein